MNDNVRNGLQEIIDKAISDIARAEGDSFDEYCGILGW